MSLKKAKETGRKINQGVWVAVNEELFPELSGVSLHVRGLNNRDFNRVQSKLSSKLKRDPKTGQVLDGAESDRVFDECLVETIVLDWTGLKESDDDPDLPFSKQKLRELLADEDLRLILRPAIVHAASDVRTEEQSATDADVKN